MLDIYHNKLGTRVASRVAEGTKTYERLRKLGNTRKMSNLGGDAAQRPVPPPKIKCRQ